MRSCIAAGEPVTAHILKMSVLSGAPCTALRSCAMRTANLAKVEPIDIHTSNIYRTLIFPAQILSAPPEGRSLSDARTMNGAQHRHAFSARQRYFVSQRFFSPHSFLARQKRMGPRSDGTAHREALHHRCIGRQNRHGRRKHTAIFNHKSKPPFLAAEGGSADVNA